MKGVLVGLGLLLVPPGLWASAGVDSGGAFRFASFVTHGPEGPETQAWTLEEYDHAMAALLEADPGGEARTSEGLRGVGSTRLERLNVAVPGTVPCWAVYTRVTFVNRTGFLPGLPPSPIVEIRPGNHPAALLGTGRVCDKTSTSYEAVVFEVNASLLACDTCASSFAQVWSDGTVLHTHVNDFRIATHGGSAVVGELFGCFSFACYRTGIFLGDGAVVELSQDTG